MMLTLVQKKSCTGDARRGSNIQLNATQQSITEISFGLSGQIYTVSNAIGRGSQVCHKVIRKAVRCRLQCDVPVPSVLEFLHIQNPHISLMAIQLLQSRSMPSNCMDLLSVHIHPCSGTDVRTYLNTYMPACKHM